MIQQSYSAKMIVGRVQPTATYQTVPLDYSKKSSEIQDVKMIVGRVQPIATYQTVPSDYSKKSSEIQDVKMIVGRVQPTATYQTVPSDYSKKSSEIQDAYGDKLSIVQPASLQKLNIKQATAQSASGQLDDVMEVLQIEQADDVDHILENPVQLGDFKGYGYSDQEEDYNQDHDCDSSEFSMYCQLDVTQQSASQHDSNREIKPQNLVKILAECPELSSSLQDLMNHRKLSPSYVKKVAFKYPNIFCLKGEEVELKPEVRICEAHCGANGCPNRGSCCSLHICKNFIMDRCYNFECVFGHNWNTGHNCSILRNLFIDDLSYQILQKLLRRKKWLSLSNDLISVCHNYNENNCENYKCTSLHICFTYIVGLAKGNFSACKKSCILSHNLMNSGCLQVLKRYGLPTNETPRDIVHSLVSANPSLVHEGKGNIKCKGNDAIDFERRGTKRKQNSLEMDSFGVQTIWSHYLNGDVDIAEICYNSVESMCDNERNGCQRLHASLHFHWQVSEDGNQWLNLRPAQVECLERSFCDPTKDGVDLPPLDPSSLDHSLKSLFILMGRNTWSSNFYNMTLVNATGNKCLYFRRLCTERIKCVKVKPSTFLWYFCNHDNVWVQYGQAESNKDVNLIVRLTSEEIEKLFLEDPLTDISFSSWKFTYRLNFRQMNQFNQTTGTLRQVKRRPAPHLHCKGMEDLPQTWKAMLPLLRVQRVPLLDTCTEFKKISDLINKNRTFGYSYIKIEKIQNPYLWRAFQNKVKEMADIGGSSGAVDLRYLFHGTRPDVVKCICEENFDWRLHGAANGKAFGQGTYFATNASYAYTYTRADVTGCRFMFVANVAVGSKITGNHWMSRPPFNPITSLPYDSTVNNLQNPSIIVKYDKQEYYPEYLVMLW